MHGKDSKRSRASWGGIAAVWAGLRRRAAAPRPLPSRRCCTRLRGRKRRNLSVCRPDRRQPGQSLWDDPIWRRVGMQRFGAWGRKRRAQADWMRHCVRADASHRRRLDRDRAVPFLYFGQLQRREPSLGRSDRRQQGQSLWDDRKWRRVGMQRAGAGGMRHGVRADACQRRRLDRDRAARIHGLPKRRGHSPRA
jgi:hypothetical protein